METVLHKTWEKQRSFIVRQLRSITNLQSQTSKDCPDTEMNNSTKLRHTFRFVCVLLAILVVQTVWADKALILENPDDAVQARVDLIRHAQSSIDAQYYVVGNDYFTLAGLALLRDAARRGCEVRLIIDGRSNMLSKDVHAELQREHVVMKLYHPVTLQTLHLLYHRMHDKGLNIDRRCMIRGGRNA